MPVLDLKINVPLQEDVKDKFIADATRKLTEILPGKKDWIMVIVQDNVTVSFKGSRDPAAFISFTNIIEAEVKDLNLKTNEIASGVTDLIHESFGVKKDRVYIDFNYTQFSRFS
eukprot:TRINITY_DN5885_c0_g1_i5.p1 TRINITY_DN5885_c0_g1~~TRINITY_DN5885_c0_g1_i5.p1  ORF type:complete len:114 (+),score=22.06 TRINITY_DN5885_c0_g1_i5:620-961(+)